MTAATGARASLRTPTVGQARVLWAVKKLRGTETGFVSTTDVHEIVDRTLQASKGVSAGEQRATFENLNACYRNGWLAPPKILGASGKNRAGEHLAWQIRRDGEAALDRSIAKQAAEQAAERQQEGAAVEAATEPAVPEQEAPAWAEEEPTQLAAVPDPEPEAETEQPEADGDEDTQAGEPDPEPEPGEPETDEEEPVVVENQVVGNQLTMRVAGEKRLKPTSSKLQIAASKDYGTEREFELMERVPVTGVLEIRAVNVKQGANGRVERIHSAKLVEIVVEGDEDEAASDA